MPQSPAAGRTGAHIGRIPSVMSSVSQSASRTRPYSPRPSARRSSCDVNRSCLCRIAPERPCHHLPAALTATARPLQLTSPSRSSGSGASHGDVGRGIYGTATPQTGKARCRAPARRPAMESVGGWPGGARPRGRKPWLTTVFVGAHVFRRPAILPVPPRAGVAGRTERIWIWRANSQTALGAGLCWADG